MTKQGCPHRAGEHLEPVLHPAYHSLPDTRFNAEETVLTVPLVEDQQLLKWREAGSLDWPNRPVTRALPELLNVVDRPGAAASLRNSLAKTSMVAARSYVALLDGGMPDQATTVDDGRRGRSASA
jgi:hypothetical protein